MSSSPARYGRIHYAWIVAAVTFLILLATAGVRASPAILMVPLEHELGWTRAAISGASAINIALFGLLGATVTRPGWRSRPYIVAGAAAAVLLVVLVWLKDRPSDVGLLPYGALDGQPPTPAEPSVARSPLGGLFWAARSREFWILAGSF